VTHTGSRKVSRIVLPRRLASDRVRLSWSVSVNAGAGELSGALAPSIASARIGDALVLAWAAASGIVPNRIMPIEAKPATVASRAPANAPGQLAGRSCRRQPP
jgi:hypothetical protein